MRNSTCRSISSSVFAILCQIMLMEAFHPAISFCSKQCQQGTQNWVLVVLCQITQLGGHLESVFKSGMSNKYCWGHLKQDLSPFVSNIVIWGQSLRHRKRVQHRQKIDCYLKCLDSYIANPITRTKTYFKCPQRTIFDTARKKVANLVTKPCCRHLFSQEKVRGCLFITYIHWMMTILALLERKETETDAYNSMFLTKIGYL